MLLEKKNFILKIVCDRGNTMMKNKTFLQKCKTGITLAVLAAVVAWVKPPATALAFNVTPIQMVEMYATSATPVYAAPDVYSPVVVYLERFTNVRVFGITDNGFYQVDLNGTYYIPGPFMVSQIEPPKTEKQKALDNLEDFTAAYRMQL